MFGGGVVCRLARCSRCVGLEMGDIFSLCLLLGDESEADREGKSLSFGEYPGEEE